MKSFNLLTLFLLCMVVASVAQTEHGISFGGGIGAFQVRNYKEYLSDADSFHMFVQPEPSFRLGYYHMIKTKHKNLKLETGLHLKIMTSSYHNHITFIDPKTGERRGGMYTQGGDWMLYFQIPAELRWEQQDHWHLKAGPVFGYARPLGSITNSPPGYFARLWDIGVTGGIGGRLSRRWSMELPSIKALSIPTSSKEPTATTN